MIRDTHRKTVGRWAHVHLALSIAGAALALSATACREETPRNAHAATSTVGTAAVSTVVPQTRGKVLLVHSYHTGYPWVDAITQGVKRALAGSHVDLEIVYMDTKRKTSEAWKKQSGEVVRQVVAEWKPDVVITADDNAQEYFAKGYVGRKTPQFVFCGVNAKPGKYGYPASNVTGILERPHFATSLDQLHKLVPDAARIAVVTDDSPTSAGALRFMKQQSAWRRIVSSETPSEFEGWQNAVRRCQDTADALAIYMYHTVKRPGTTESMPPKEVMAWTVENSRIPIVGFFIFTIDDGALCGFLESGVEHGFRAGQIALELLDGKPAGGVPLVTALEGQSMLNLAAARRLGIEVPDAAIRSTEIVVGD